MGRRQAHRLGPRGRPDDPLGMPDEAMPIYGTPTLGHGSTTRTRAELRQHHAAWQFSQFLHGEQGAMICVGPDRRVGARPRREVLRGDPDHGRGPARRDLRPVPAREGRHASTRSTTTCRRCSSDTLRDSRWDMPYLGMQVLIEGLALAAFGLLRDITDQAAAQADPRLRHAGRGAARRLRPDGAARLLPAADRRRARRARGVRRRGLLPDARPAPRRGGLENLGIPTSRRPESSPSSPSTCSCSARCCSPGSCRASRTSGCGARRCRRRTSTWASSSMGDSDLDALMTPGRGDRRAAGRGAVRRGGTGPGRRGRVGHRGRGAGLRLSGRGAVGPHWSNRSARSTEAGSRPTLRSRPSGRRQRRIGVWH